MVTILSSLYTNNVWNCVRLLFNSSELRGWGLLFVVCLFVYFVFIVWFLLFLLFVCFLFFVLFFVCLF